jgi:predicted nucleic acid-binding protein
VRFWDSSALVPLLVEEEVTGALRDLYLGEPGTITWWGTPVECASAIARLEREERLSPPAVKESLQLLDTLARHWHRIEPVDAVLETARRLLRVHPLRAADSLQLAAAFLASEGRPKTLEFVCLDDRLGTAAEREGFRVRDRSHL